MSDTDSHATFGALLRHHRLAAGLTQEKLAEQAGLSVHGIQKLERGATHPYRDTAQKLLDVLQLGPVERLRLQAAIQPVRRHTSAPRTLVAGRHNLALPITRLIGREHDLADLTRRLPNARLLTLTGVGGCGKTRLALELAANSLQHYPDGVWLVELGPLVDPALVPHRVGAAIGIRETADEPLMQTLANALHVGRVLLVLDNCEHLLDACAILVEPLLRTCPSLKVLATSREPIGISGEVSWRVPSLAVPDARQSPADLHATAAEQLFVERATAVRPGFEVTPRNAPAVTNICRRLDGIPLALELAAAQVDAMTPEQLAVRLDQRFRVLTGGNRAALPRQQTLSATLDWSYKLLSKLERHVFERVTLFAGGWTLEAAEAVCAGDGLDVAHVLGCLVRLVRKSLVTTLEAADGTERYGLLETVREYARGKLATRGAAAAAALRRRHAQFYSDLVRQLNPAVETASAWVSLADTAQVTVDRIEPECDNLRAALGWWLEVEQPAEGLELAMALSSFWAYIGVYDESRRWLEATLELADRVECVPDQGAPAESAVPPIRRAVALSYLGVLTNMQGDYVQARAFLEAAVVLWRNLQQTAALAHGLAVLGLSLWLTGEADRATTVLDESLSLGRAGGHADTVCMSLRNLGLIARWHRQFERSAIVFRESVLEAQSLGRQRGYSLVRGLSNLGRAFYLQGDGEQAGAILLETLELVRETHLWGYVLADCLDWLAAVEGSRGAPGRAARLFGAAATQWRGSGGMRYKPDHPAHERDVADVRAQLDPEAFAALWAEGQAMIAEESVVFALEGAGSRHINEARHNAYANC